jgi:AcrR family transcriptional regulator
MEMSTFSPIEEKIDPRIKRTRALIGNAFSQLLAEKGFQAVSVQDITEKAGVNRTTFYLHFADKYALLDYSVSQTFRQELEKRTLNLCHYTPENLRSLIITVGEFIINSNAHCAHADTQFETLVETQVKNQVQELLQVWGDKTGIMTDVKTVAIAASWAIYGLALEWGHDKKRSSSERFADGILPRIEGILGLTELVEA